MAPMRTCRKPWRMIQQPNIDLRVYDDGGVDVLRLELRGQGWLSRKVYNLTKWWIAHVRP